MTERKKILLRLDPAVHDALTRWAGDELRSTNAQIEFLLRGALSSAGRLPGEVGRIPRRGRPPRGPAEAPPAEAPSAAAAPTGDDGPAAEGDHDADLDGIHHQPADGSEPAGP